MPKKCALISCIALFLINCSDDKTDNTNPNLAMDSGGGQDASMDFGNHDSEVADAMTNDVKPVPDPLRYRAVPCIDYVGQAAEGMECAFLKMPQNRVRDTGLDLELFAVRPSTPPPGNALPVVVLAGGPGTPHAGFAARKGLPLKLSALLGREVIYYEQRGLAPSEPSTACSGLDTGISESLAFRACRSNLEEQGVDVHSFNTLENAADIAEIPAVLGLEQIDLIAGSYGTRLASKVLARHPEAIRAAVLGGVDVPGAPDSEENSASFQLLFENAGNYYGEQCALDEACSALHPNFDFSTLKSQLDAIIARDGSVEIFGRPFTNTAQIAAIAFPMMYIAQIRNMFFGVLYHTANASMPTYLAHIGEGDPAEGGAFLGRLLMQAQEAVFGGSSVMSHVTRCYDGQDEFCAVIGDRIDDYPSTDFTEPSGSAHPTLFISGELDPATPIANIDTIIPLYPNSTHSKFECLGHDISRISNLANGTCVADQVRVFLDDPSASLPDCAASLCASLPLIPAKTELAIQVGDYVEDFDN